MAGSGGKGFPAEFALADQCDSLVDGDSRVFADQNQTINMLIEVSCPFVILKAIAHPISASTQWPGYDGWGAQVSSNVSLR